jgi:hypothetical protein
MSIKGLKYGLGSTLLLVSLVLASSVELAAQTTTGMIRGRVLNEAGAPVGAAQVVLANTETGVRSAARCRWRRARTRWWGCSRGRTSCAWK